MTATQEPEHDDMFVAAVVGGGAVPRSSAPQNKGAAPPQAGKPRTRRPAQDRAGPVPRLPDGHPDLTGIWNGFGGGGRGADAPNILPWAAKIVADRRASRARKISKRAACPAVRRARRPITRRSSPRRKWC